MLPDQVPRARPPGAGGGECPLDAAFVEACRLTPDGAALASEDRLPLTLPEIENRNVRFIASVPQSQTVFGGVEGGLLRGTDNGNSFKFVIHAPLSGARAIRTSAPSCRARASRGRWSSAASTRCTAVPNLAWTQDSGASWTDIPTLVPGHDRKGKDEDSTPSISALPQDPEGRIIVVSNGRADSQGRLMLLTVDSN